MEEERAEKLRGLLDTGLHQLYGLWDEIGENQHVKDFFEMLDYTNLLTSSCDIL